MAVSRAAKRGRVAILTRYRAPDDPELIEARRDYWATELADHVQQVVAQAPQLTEQQIGRIVLILARGSEAG
jgi:hypothetical protein